MDIREKQPKDVLKPECLEHYRSLHESIWHRLIHLHHTIITLEKMEEFPFDYFYDPQEMTFWSTVRWNFVSMGVIVMHGLVDDQVSEAHTLLRFKNKVLEWVRPKFKGAYQEVLKQTKLEHDLEPIRKRITHLRHKVVAHSFLDESTHLPVRNVPGVSVPDLRKLFDSVERLFEACCFCHGYMTTTIDYDRDSTIGGKPVPSSIDTLLDCVAKNSALVNLPEKRAGRWAEIKKHRPENELQVMNEYRRKFGLHEA